jgi:hypothetical protein
MSDGNSESPGPILTLDAAGEFAAGATVLAAYWPKDFAHQVVLKSRVPGRPELVIPVEPGVLEKAGAILTQWADMGSGASASAKLLRARIRTEVARVTVSVLS